MVAGIAPREALDRLRRFTGEYQIRKRKFDSFFAGERLFGLPHQDYPALDETKKEIQLLDKLYNLYSKVLETIAQWKDINWLDLKEQIDDMIEQIEVFGRECTRLPGVLKGWDAYKELRQQVDDMTEILPLIKELAKESIRDRHWEEIIEITGKDEIPYLTPDTMILNHLLQANMLSFKEEIEDIADSADKQLKLEKQLNTEIESYWNDAELEIKPYADILQPCIISGNIDEIKEKLEEHISQLNQMLAMKHVKPFRGRVQEKFS